MAYQFILLNQAGAVARLTMNRPERLNALNVEMGLELLDALERVEHDPEVRVVTLTGAGRGFCAGDDLRGMTDERTPPQARLRYADPAKQYVYGRGRWPSVIRHMMRMPKPTVAIVNGHAHGAGFNLALGCDFRVMSTSATLAVPFLKWGMATGTNRLQQFVGVGKALEWAMLGVSLSAEEAERWGLVTRVAPPEQLEEVAAEVVERLASGPTAALGYTKLAIYRSWEEGPDAAYERQGLAQHFARQTEDYVEGRRAFREKRAPRFTGKTPPLPELP